MKNNNSAITSKQSFAMLNASGQRTREKQKVLAAIIKNQPITSRSLVKKTGLERGNITRLLFDLVHASTPIVKEAFIKECKITGRPVKHYTLI